MPMKAGETPPPGVVSVEGVFDVSHGFFIPARACERGRSEGRIQDRRKTFVPARLTVCKNSRPWGQGEPRKIICVIIQNAVFLYQKITSNFDTKTYIL
jgi:hypothetical protein